MKVKLTALKDFEAINTWGEETSIHEGDAYEGTRTSLNGGGQLVTIDINNVPTIFWEKTVKEFFKIEEVE